ncbi:hypothetical protein GCM10010503_22920 [Streptomyces lucensis JCM 4490]|uniref:Uncharacterized protein n=1 Tax=Streptomyces lucensis JCM 4490 TaxID=1306176 RepID=A0A918MQU8_9ACTN|nr:hypothetical protein GCM10010503_22920 [Streptomyces lucensis JCM 4490]
MDTGTDMDGARMIAPGSLGNSTGAVQQNGGLRTNGLIFNYVGPGNARQVNRGADHA